jgi:hypothetical protein
VYINKQLKTTTYGVMSENFGDRVWADFVEDFGANFHESWRDEHACGFLAHGQDSAEIRGINQLDVKLLSKWCAHHKLFYVVETSDCIIVRLQQTTPLDVDNINRVAYSLDDNGPLLSKLKMSHPRDWRVLEQILTPFIHKDEFKCSADASQQIMQFDHDICIDMQRGTINSTVVDDWFFNADKNMRIIAHPTFIRFIVRQSETKHKPPRQAGKFNPFARQTDRQPRNINKYQESRDSTTPPP